MRPEWGSPVSCTSLRHALRAERVTWLEGQCSASGQAVPYQPILHVLRMALRIDNDDSATRIRDKIQLGVRRSGLDPDPAVPVLETLLGLAVSGDALPRLDPRTRRQRIFETIQALTDAGAKPTLVVVIEDLHWIDTTSEEYLDQLVAGLAGMPLLLLTTSRPASSPRSTDRAYSAQVGLDLLEPLQVSAMVLDTAGHRQRRRISRR